MRAQFNFNSRGDTVCPICGKGTPEPAILVPINTEGATPSSTVEAVQIHVECILHSIEYLRLESGCVIIAVCDHLVRKERKL